MRLTEIRDLNLAAGTFFCKCLLHLHYCETDFSLVAKDEEKLNQEQLPHFPELHPNMFYNSDEIDIDLWDIYRMSVKLEKGETSLDLISVDGAPKDL